MRLKRLNTNFFADAKKRDFVIVLGATEQHGPFIPFGTDTYIVDYLIDRLEEKMPNLVILPTLEFSRSEEHKGFPGTVYLRASTLKLVMRDICDSIIDQANTISIVTFHHNDPYILEFIEEYNSGKVKFVEVFSEDDDLKIEEMLGGPCDDHAGNSEISNMYFIDEDTVILPNETYKKDYIENPFEFDDLSVKSKDGIADQHPNWVIDKEIGKQILEIYASRLIRNFKA